MKPTVSPAPAKVKKSRPGAAKIKLQAGKNRPGGKKQVFTAYAPPLLDWYDRHRRLLSWRALPDARPDPYRIWLSEIMLQQTTVAAVGPYFQRFIARWPTLNDLANAPLDDILTLWAGLGYYRRARMLHACAQSIVSDYQGEFPQTLPELLALPGFGPYTAAAVRAIAFDQPANVVDGNVERVMARVFAIQTPLPAAKPALRKAAELLLPAKRHGDYAQALMDLGATICTPRNPKCLLCPWQAMCAARQQGIAEQLPRRRIAKARPVRRALAFVAINADGGIFLQQRPAAGLLGGMLEVPSSPWLEQPMPDAAKVKKYAPTAIRFQPVAGIVRHVFSHFTLELAVMTGKAARVNPKAGGIWVTPDRLGTVALPSVMVKVIRHAIKPADAKSDGLR